MRSFAKFAVVGVSSVVLLKLFATIFLPALGMLVGLLMLTAKVALMVAVAYFVYTLLRPRTRDEEADVEMNEEELEIVVEEASDEESA
jgi:hypothetical protein